MPAGPVQTKNGRPFCQGFRLHSFFGKRVTGLSLWPIIILAFAWLSPGAWAAALDLDQISGIQSLDQGQLSYLKDPDGRLTLPQVMATADRFQPLQGNLGKGYTSDVYWLKLPLQRHKAASRWWLEIQPSYLDDLQLYVVHPDGSVTRKHTGDRLPLKSRDARYGTFVFNLEVPSGSSTLYLRVQTSSSMAVIARIQNVQAFPVPSTARSLAIGLYLSIITTVLLLSAVYVFIRPRLIYGVYLLYLISQWCFALSTTGIAAEYLFPDSPLIPDRMVGFSMSMAVVFGLIFFADLLRLKDDFPRHLLLFRLVTAGAALCGVAALVDAYVYVAPYMLGAVLLLMLASTVVIWRRLTTGDNTDRLLAASLLAYMIFVSCTVLPLLGLLPVSETSLVVAQFGNVLHLLVLQISIMLSIRQAENDALVAKQEAERKQMLYAEQDHFLAMITQEIHTPVAAIEMETRALQDVDPNTAQPERARRYERMTMALKRVALLMDLTSNRHRISDPTSTPREHIDLVALTRQILSQSSREHQQRTQLSPGTGSAIVAADAGLLQFALLNLIDNAWKYSPPASAVDIDIGVDRAEATVRWCVTDRGTGIPVEERANIFEKYYRSGERSGVPGLGLGLYIAHNLIGQHNGTLNYVDRDGVGACFEIRLPLVPEN